MARVRSALTFLIGTSMRGRLRTQASRLEKPRYAVAFLFGVLYVGFLVFGRAGAAGAPGGMLIGSAAESILPLLILGMVASAWLLSADASALAFTPAEVSLLFAAPLTRRQLLLYRIARAQPAILLSAMFMALFLGRVGTGVSYPLIAVGYWVLLSTINLHTVGAALVRARAGLRGPSSGPQRLVARTLGMAMGLIVVVALMGQRPDSGSGADEVETVAMLAPLFELTSAPLARIVLAPFRAVVAPVLATSPADWVVAFTLALAIFGAHLWWVLRADTAFEEVAVEASRRRAKVLEAVRNQRSPHMVDAPKAAARSIRLAAHGHPAIAIVWKNTLAAARQFPLSQLLFPVAIAGVVSMTLYGRTVDLAQGVAIGCLFLALTLSMSGALTLRNDLRSDMLVLPLLKTLPLTGRQMVLAQMASSAVILTLVQTLLIAIAMAALGLSTNPVPVPSSVQAGLLIAAPFALLVLNSTGLILLNATAVLFPSWMRLGPSGGGGIELMGQAMLTMLSTVLSMLVLLIVPGLAIGVTLALAGAPSLPGVATAVLLGAALLAAEAYGIAALLGRSFERTEPAHVT